MVATLQAREEYCCTIFPALVEGLQIGSSFMRWEVTVLGLMPPPRWTCCCCGLEVQLKCLCLNLEAL